MMIQRVPQVMKRCPRCNSEDIEVIDKELGFIKCKKCGYDGLKEDLSSFEERRSQREKSRFSPYRQSGGSKNKGNK